MAETKRKPTQEQEPKITGAEQKQRCLIKKRRSGVVLTRDEVREIKAGRKKLRKEMKSMGIKSRKEFELTASSMGLYFDKSKLWALLWWFLHGKAGWILLGAAAALLLGLFAFSAITELQGHFTVNMGSKLFAEGFTLSETIGFENPTSRLFSSPAEGVRDISILDIPEDVDDYDGQHNAKDYFASTFYIRNEGESTVNYTWELRLNSESQKVSSAAWVMVFEDGLMVLYARANADGEVQALPAMDVNDVGYPVAPFYDKAKDPEGQFQLIYQNGALNYWRIIPRNFLSDTVIAQGKQVAVAPQEVHKYTVVIWLEGDDPDCTDDLIGGHVGYEMYMELEEL